MAYLELFITSLAGWLACKRSAAVWNYMEQNIRISFDIQTHLTVVDVLFGIKHNYGKVKTKRINHVVLIAKMCISMYKKLTNAFLPLSMIFENQLKLRNV